jgi:hypothetical protein
VTLLDRIDASRAAQALPAEGGPRPIFRPTHRFLVAETAA